MAGRKEEYKDIGRADPFKVGPVSGEPIVLASELGGVVIETPVSSGLLESSTTDFSGLPQRAELIRTPQHPAVKHILDLRRYFPHVRVEFPAGSIRADGGFEFPCIVSAQRDLKINQG